MTSQKSTLSHSNTPHQLAAGKGMPAKDPKAQRALPGAHETPEDSSVKNTLELPSERDQAVDMTSSEKPLVIQQAAKDVDRGIKDTSKASEMNQAYKKLKP